MPIVIRISRIVMTIINSRSVKPSHEARFPLQRLSVHEYSFTRLFMASSFWARTLFLPVRVFRSIKRCSLRLRVHVEYVLPPPTVGIGVVLNGSQPPVGPAGHRVDGNAPQESDLPVVARAKL